MPSYATGRWCKCGIGRFVSPFRVIRERRGNCLMGRLTMQAWFSAFSTLVECFGPITFLLLSTIMAGVNWNAFLHRRIRRAKNSFVLKNETRTKTSVPTAVFFLRMIRVFALSLIFIINNSYSFRRSYVEAFHCGVANIRWFIDRNVSQTASNPSSNIYSTSKFTCFSSHVRGEIDSCFLNFLLFRRFMC